MTSILTITGNDNSGFSGLQQDVKVISEMGAHALTAISCLVTENGPNATCYEFLEEKKVRSQVAAMIMCYHPKAVKVGLMGNPLPVKAIAEEIVACKRIVISPGIVFSDGGRMASMQTIDAIMRHLVPIASILILRCKEAEVMLGMKIATDKDMRCASNAFLDMGAEYVLLRSGKTMKGRVTALLAGGGTETFFSSYFIEGWQQHGVGGALSAAIATRLGLGDDVPTAVHNAHEYVHSRVVYAVSEEEQHLRPADIYNTFMNLIVDNYAMIHDVTTYADRLHVSTRYLAIITCQTVSKSPKQVIADYLMEKARQLLMNSRLSVKEIAAELGFKSNPVFCKFFKQQEGKTPSEFRMSVESLS